MVVQFILFVVWWLGLPSTLWCLSGGCEGCQGCSVHYASCLVVLVVVCCTIHYVNCLGL